MLCTSTVCFARMSHLAKFTLVVEEDSENGKMRGASEGGGK